MEKNDKNPDPRVLRTRQALRQALIELIPEKGYQQISVKDIAQRAGLNRTTFYLHFQNKDDLLASGFELTWEELIPALPLAALGGESLPPRLTRDAILVDFQHLAAFGPLYRAVLGRKGAPQYKLRLQDQIFASFRDRMRQSRPPLPQRGLPLEPALAFVAGSYLGLLEWWLDHGQPYSPEQMADLVIQLFNQPPCDILGVDLDPEENQDGSESE